jgi:DNA mismatch endonuclease (patch repair protein)
MADVLTARQRSFCMSQIRGKDTKPEYFIRSGLFALGFRYRLHRRDLPGCPDIVLPKHRAVIFVHGCLWHGHKCHLFKWPKTNSEFWRRKINRNREIDVLAVEQLRTAGWRVMTVWECAIKGRARLKPPKLFERMARWLLSERQRSEIAGRSTTKLVERC